MYKLHLIRKYLLKRKIAWVSLISVMLCTAMVLVVISVMGGWLEMFRSSFRGMSGDVMVGTPENLLGFPYYEEMLGQIRKLPDVQAGTSVIVSAGLINIGGQRREMVEVDGINIDELNAVGDFATTLNRQYMQRQGTPTTQPSQPSFDLLPNVDYELAAGKKAIDPRSRPGMIISDSFIGLKKGEPVPEVLYELPTTLTMVPVIPHKQTDVADAVTAAFWVVDASRSRIWQLDYNKVYVPFDVLQKDLHMDAHDDEPARVSQLQIKAKPGVDLIKLRNQVQAIVTTVNQQHGVDSYLFPAKVKTWQEVQGKFLDAVEHEVVLTTALFGIISLVAVLLIFCIFYMIVIEKTKDIGIIKSVGATGMGILQLFLGYGLAIGVLGSGLGLLLAYLIVHNINELHAQLGKWMHVVIWDPETYQFDMIPNTMNTHTVIWVVSIAILSAVIGAFIPALKAAVMNPVDALRYE